MDNTLSLAPVTGAWGSRVTGRLRRPVGPMPDDDGDFPREIGAETGMASNRRGLHALTGRGVNLEEVTDEALLQLVARGHQQAFAQLYDRFADRVYGLVRRVLRDPAQSEEVAQEVFVGVWRQAHRYDRSKGSATVWLLTLAHRRAVDRVRSEQASRTRDDHVGQRERAPAFDSVAETVETSLEHEQVRRALDQLTDLQREAIELAYYGGNTYREVADLLDTPLATIKTRLRDGLIRLRDALGASE